ncbi:MAG: amino acid racemase [Nanoarchaeota archaeon]|nr:amino acid racemase [Nanoarchaeota archaeon]
MNPYKTIGVLGGNGPAASAELYRRMVRHCQKLGAVQDTEFPPIVMYSLPLEGFDETGVIDEALVFKQLSFGLQTLRKAGCDFAVIPCNTLHMLLGQLYPAITLPVLSIIEKTVDRVAKSGVKSVALLGSETTLASGMYQHTLLTHGISCACPTASERTAITRLILEVMGGKLSKSGKDAVVSALRRLAQNADAVILGCTELPLVISQSDVSVPLFDSLQILAETAVESALLKNKKNTD